MTTENKKMKLFPDSFSLETLIKKATCFNVQHRSYLQKQESIFKKQYTRNWNTDFPKLAIVSLKPQFFKDLPKRKLDIIESLMKIASVTV